MQFILQVSTGGFPSCSVQDVRQMKDRLENLLCRLPVSRIIFGWSIAPEVSETIVELAHQHRKQALLWLPAFADVEYPDRADSLEAIAEKPENAVQTCEGESFQFVCPNSPQNREAVVASLDHVLSGVPVDGVFLDRIRYPSAVFSPYDFFGCHCSRCEQRYRDAGIDTDRLRREAVRKEDLDAFAPSSLEAGRYHYDDPDLEGLMEVKRRSVLSAIRELTQVFRRRGLVVGIDAFAPALADLVGQDLARLSDIVDFMKPMMYYRTAAPAGVPYELAAYGAAFARRISALWGQDVGQSGSIGGQLLSIRGRARVCPGIEVNRVPGICEPREADLRQTLRALAEAGCEETVLSWDVLRAPEESLAPIEKSLCPGR